MSRKGGKISVKHSSKDTLLTFR